MNSLIRVHPEPKIIIRKNVIKLNQKFRPDSAGFRAISASGAADVEASPLGGFALDQECLQRCGFPSIGAPGDGLMDLPAPFRALFGSALSGNPGFSPPGSPQNPETPAMTRRARTPRPATNATSTGNL